MPIYEFKCLKCGHVFELLKLKKENEGLKMKCPKCGSSEVEKILSTMNIARSASGKSAARRSAAAVPVPHAIPGPKR
jgi:putative FmdB family regulatory protein